MTDFNPYEILGLDQNAQINDQMIKAAYLKKAKETHPDLSGSQEAFEQVKLAYDILSDPDRREEYDRDGHINAGKADDEDALVYQRVTNFFVSIIDAMQDAPTQVNLDQFDLIVGGKKFFTQENQKCETAVRSVGSKIQKFEKVIKRLKRKKEGNDIITAMLKAHIGHLGRLVKQNNYEIKLNNRAIGILDDYEFTTETLTRLIMPTTGGVGFHGFKPWP